MRPVAFQIAYRMLGSVSEAEDIVQETLIRVHRALEARFQTTREQREERMNSRATPPVLFKRPGHSPTGSERLLPVRAAYAALAWVVVFFAFHVYWYAGGSFGLNGELPDLVPDSVVGWIFEVLEGAAWLLGPWVCLAIARGWPRGSMRRAALIVVWLGCAVLIVRGGAGLIDDLTRAVGLLPNGITGLSHKQTMGAAYYRSASALWSGKVTDGYFFAGGLIFGVLAHRYRPPRSRARHGVPPWTSS